MANVQTNNEDLLQKNLELAQLNVQLAKEMALVAKENSCLAADNAFLADLLKTAREESLELIFNKKEVPLLPSTEL